MKLASYFVLLITLQLVRHIECDIITNFISELKEWTDYFGLTECDDLIKTQGGGSNLENEPELHQSSEKEQDKSQESNTVPPEEECSIELSKQKELLQESVEITRTADSLIEIDKADFNELKNIKEVDSGIKTKSENFEKIVKKTLLENGSEEEIEIIIYNDMIKLDLDEENLTKGEINANTQNIGTNNENANTLLSESHRKRENENIMAESKDGILEVTENLSAGPEKVGFIELPLADDDDTKSASASMTNCHTVDSLEACSAQDATRSEEISQKDILKSVKEDGSNSEKCSTCEDNIPYSEEKHDQLLQENNKIEGHNNIPIETPNIVQESNDAGSFNDQISAEGFRNENDGVQIETTDVKDEHEEILEIITKK